MGRIRGNWMIQLNPTNKKLIDRGSRIVAHLAWIDYPSACMNYTFPFSPIIFGIWWRSGNDLSRAGALQRLGC